MIIEITRREVLNNLIRFKDNLSQLRDDQESKKRDQEERQKKKKRTYRILLNRHTGDMRFAQKISAIEHHFQRKIQTKGKVEDWHEVHLIVVQDGEKEAHFDLCDAKDQILTRADLDPLAWRIAKETVDVLNLKSKEIHFDEKSLPEELILQDLSSIHLAVPKDNIEDLPGWMGSIGRDDAEKLLADQTIGTYLIREGDEITLSCAFHLNEVNFASIHPYLATVVEKENKITDILLLKTDRGWTHYLDDPDLSDPAYQFHPSPQGMLLSLSHILKKTIPMK